MLSKATAIAVGAGIATVGLTAVGYITMRSSVKKHNDKERITSFFHRQVAGVKSFGRKLVHTEQRVA